MKKILIALLSVILFICFVLAYNKTNEYTLPGTICQVANNHWVRVVTEDGIIREFDSYDYVEGQKVIVTLNNKDTPNKNDDTIVKISSAPN